MLELGTTSREQHRRIAGLARDLGFEVVIVGTDEYGLEPVADADAALAALARAPLHAGDAVLVKASRAAGLERVAARLVAGEADAASENGATTW
jgi:UDP-N-acetylmuramoyl-tripeptide--D-alanyl-D-alanine ligase